jgi:transposase
LALAGVSGITLIFIVARAVGVSRTTVQAGIHELKGGRGDTPGEASTAGPPRIRRTGAGRQRRQDQDETLLADLNRLLDPVTRGDPMSALRWTCKSTTKLAAELQALGHRVSQVSVWRLLDELGYSMQSNRKTRDGDDHPDRNAQFEFISTTVNDFLKRALSTTSLLGNSARPT